MFLSSTCIRKVSDKLLLVLMYLKNKICSILLLYFRMLTSDESCREESNSLFEDLKVFIIN